MRITIEDGKLTISYSNWEEGRTSMVIETVEAIFLDDRRTSKEEDKVFANPPGRRGKLSQVGKTKLAEDTLRAMGHDIPGHNED